MKHPLPPHPFPARMAPEVALRAVAGFDSAAVVLDPMCGSGTSLRMAAEAGHEAIGVDLDPLAVLIAKVWTSPPSEPALKSGWQRLFETARATDHGVHLPWIDDDAETGAFVDYWFAEEQKRDLRRLAAALIGLRGKVADALRVAVSRLIITKDHGASLARDVSHSRPHRVRDSNDFDVMNNLERSVAALARRVAETPPGRVRVRRGDARRLSHIPDGSVDLIVTSPPYATGIDYLRASRLSLVWLGYRISELRLVRSQAIGTERRPSTPAPDWLLEAVAGSISLSLSPRWQQIVLRYAIDLYESLREMARVLRDDGEAVIAIGNSTIEGKRVNSAKLVEQVSKLVGMHVARRSVRRLPAQHRYLPPPGRGTSRELGQRIRQESILSLART